MKKLFILLAILISTGSGAATNTGTEADHDQLRQLLATAREAINAGQPELLVPFLHKDHIITVITQEIVNENKQIKQWYAEWFQKPDSPLQRMTTEPRASILTNIYDGKFGVCYGTSVDTYELKDGRTFKMDAKWTATVLKENGQWKLLALHVGVDPINNALIDSYRSALGLGGVMIEIKQLFSP